MNLAGRGSSKLIDDNRRTQDRTTTVCSLSNTHTHTARARLRKQYRRSKKERSLCMDGARRLIGSDDDLFLFFSLFLCRMSKQEFLYCLQIFFLFIDLSVYMLSLINKNYSNQYAR
jgi:hypothetical protein